MWFIVAFFSWNFEKTLFPMALCRFEKNIESLKTRALYFAGYRKYYNSILFVSRCTNAHKYYCFNFFFQNISWIEFFLFVVWKLRMISLLVEPLAMKIFKRNILTNWRVNQKQFVFLYKIKLVLIYNYFFFLHDNVIFNYSFCQENIFFLIFQHDSQISWWMNFLK